MSKYFKKTNSRIRVFQLLFAWELGGMELEQKNLDILREVYNENNKPDNIKLSKQLLQNLQNNLSDIDFQIDQYSNHWKIYRMGKVDLALLRLGTSEILYSELAPAIIINEIVNLAKIYGSEKSPGFVNGLLNAILTNNKPS